MSTIAVEETTISEAKQLLDDIKRVAAVSRSEHESHTVTPTLSKKRVFELSQKIDNLAQNVRSVKGSDSREGGPL